MDALARSAEAVRVVPLDLEAVEEVRPHLLAAPRGHLGHGGPTRLAAASAGGAVLDTVPVGDAGITQLAVAHWL